MATENTSLGSHVMPRSLVVTLHPRIPSRAVESAVATDKVLVHPLFSHDIANLEADAEYCQTAHGVTIPDLTRHYRVRADDERLPELRERLRAMSEVDGAYILPPVATPTHLCGRLQPLAQQPPRNTPELFSHQTYFRSAANGGFDVDHAWNIPGGKGEDVRIIHIEAAWNLNHEDLLDNQGGSLGTQSQDFCLRQHGTAVLGILGGDANQRGISGICPRATLQTIGVADVSSPEGPEVPTAIRRAARRLRPGDIIVLLLQHPGDRVAHIPNETRDGYIPAEWWPVTLAAIQYATARGVIVVEAAGNGNENLDDPRHDRGDVFPRDWKNPFRREASDSGAILVGAGAPPPGTHDRSWGADRSRLEFSNFGAAIDVQAWGREVTTCGYGSLQGGPSESRWYTDEFGGTSSAAPIVAGLLACIQGIRRKRGAQPLTPREARELLRTTGLPQQDGEGRPASQRIGSRPDLKELIAKAL